MQIICQKQKKHCRDSDKIIFNYDYSILYKHHLMPRFTCTRIEEGAAPAIKFKILNQIVPLKKN